MEILLWILVALIGYFLGCCNGAVIISKFIMKDDIRTHGSGNAGLTNYFRTYGGFQSLLVLAIDVVKTLLSCQIAWWIFRTPEAKMIGGFCTMIGHCFPVTAGFKGGKGILCGVSLAIMMDWRVFAIIFGLFAAVVLITRYVSLGSILASAAFWISFFVFFPESLTIRVTGSLAAILALYCHRQNMVRLIKGTERKLTFHKK